ncbi:MAG: 2-oxoacid:acceptor oxidoreductase family protein [Rhodospirillales bacterium]|nr:2-oxoacid:acceptor oxidoreductase family protein [Rhodospirillales bacterium]
MKTAGRILGTALFLEGYNVQDAPRYGAERRGAPITAYVRADKTAINERGIIINPDLIVVADDSLIPMPAAGVTQGIGPDTVLLINSGIADEEWRRRLNISSRILILPTEDYEDRSQQPYIGTVCAGAAARLCGIVTLETLRAAVRQELGLFDENIIAENIEKAVLAYDFMAPHEGLLIEGKEVTAVDYVRPGWVDIPIEDALISSPAIHGAATSVQVLTGLWRTMRPIIDYENCNKCAWICGSFCPDNAITTDDRGYPAIDYDHCKGCLICVAQCPPHAISALPEASAAKRDQLEYAV